MAKKKARGQRANEEALPGLPPGVKLLRTPKGHLGTVRSVAFDPQGETLASGSHANTVMLWDARNGKLLRPLGGRQNWVFSVAFDWQGETLASGSKSRIVKLSTPLS